MPIDADIVHYPFFDPFAPTLPSGIGRPLVVTVHDLIPIAHPDHFIRGLRGSMKWHRQSRILRRSQAIITDSDSSKKDIVALLPYKERDVHVVRLAPSLQIETKRSLDKAISNKLNNKYVLYVGDINWNKNVPGLLRAFDKVRRSTRGRILLALVGGVFIHDLEETRELNHFIDELDLESDIVRLGFVPDDQLPLVYKKAQVLVQPSFAEGFGFPVLDGMISGVPVVCSNVSSLAEIAGPAMQVNPDNPDAIANGISTVLSLSRREREALLKRQYEWVIHFSWEQVARETVDVYKHVLMKGNKYSL
jgi:glycosyltransferase involved in cell wall biosynthesis